MTVFDSPTCTAALRPRRGGAIALLALWLFAASAPSAGSVPRPPTDSTQSPRSGTQPGARTSAAVMRVMRSQGRRALPPIPHLTGGAIIGNAFRTRAAPAAINGTSMHLRSSPAVIDGATLRRPHQ